MMRHLLQYLQSQRPLTFLVTNTDQSVVRDALEPLINAGGLMLRRPLDFALKLALMSWSFINTPFIADCG